MESMAGDALSAITDQTFENLKAGAPAFEELHKAASKYQQLLEQTAAAAATFAEQLGKVAASASRARGDTATLGQRFLKLASGHQERAAADTGQARKMAQQFVNPLAKRIKADAKAVARMEEDFKGITKEFRSDLKKAAGSTVKAQKRVDKKGEERMSALEQAQQHLDNQAKGFEAFNQRILRTVLIEERRRYCYLVDNYISVFGLDFGEAGKQSLIETLQLTLQPESLPAASMELIRANSSSGTVECDDDVIISGGGDVNTHDQYQGRLRQGSMNLPRGAVPLPGMHNNG